MPAPWPAPRAAGPRDLLYFASPELWPAWPFLPLIRHRAGDLDCGLLCDPCLTAGAGGPRLRVVLCNLFLLPDSLGGFLALPREEFDSPLQVAQAGWVVD